MHFIYRKTSFGIFAICLFMVCVVIMYQTNLDTRNYDNMRKKLEIVDTNKKDVEIGFVVDTIGCQIPDLDPFDLEVRKFYYYTGSKVCPNVDVYARANQTHLYIDIDRAKEIFGNNVVCGYKRIWRKENCSSDETYFMDENYRFESNPIKVSDEFLNVGCEIDSKSVYVDFFPFIQVKPKVEEKCNINFNRWIEETKETVKERLSLTFVGVDSISRLNMLRHMPKTFNYLRKEMNAIDLQGYTKIADNTFVNIVPMLSGLFVEECWNEYLKDDSLDYLNLIWKEFAEKGYRTLFAEDYPEIAIFNYLKAGFFRQPTDYYFRPFTQVANENMRITENCYNNRLEVDIVMQWLIEFLEKFKSEPTFAFIFNTRLTHTDLNDAGYADEPYLNFLTKFHQSNFNNNSILIFYSDHGIRFGDIRQTYTGKIEERMPFLFLVFPQWFQSKYSKIWKNLETNQNRLTTPFDIYATLKDILYFTGKYEEANLNDRGISLFLEIPSERTCKDAAILPHWCVCQEKISVNTTAMSVINAARKIVEVINSKIYSDSKCATLELDQIIDARATGLSEKILKFEKSVNDVVNRTVHYGNRINNIVNYLITISVKPSKGLFEGTVQYFEAKELYVVSNEISRINLYGNQSNCVNDARLRKFCFCK